jgi:hypothetical protein
MRHLTLLLAAACLAQAAGAQQAVSVATPDRDGAAIYIAETQFIVTRLAAECLALVGRAESPQTFAAGWQQRNARYMNASTRYMGLRVEEATAAGGAAQRDAMQDAFRKAVQDSGEQAVRSLLQGRREDGCMYGITLVDTGALDISSKLPQFDKLEALARWAQQ